MKPFLLEKTELCQITIRSSW